MMKLKKGQWVNFIALSCDSIGTLRISQFDGFDYVEGIFVKSIFLRRLATYFLIIVIGSQTLIR